MKSLFVFNDENNAYSQELELAFSRFTSDGFAERVLLSELSFSLLKNKEVDIVVGDELPLKWIDILKEKKIVSLVFGDAIAYHHKADIVIDFKGTDSALYFSGEAFSMKNICFAFEEVLELVFTMSWDTNFFGFPIAFVGSRYLTESIHAKIENFVNINNIKLIQYLCNCHDDLSVQVAERNGFHFTDIRLTFSLDLRKTNVDPTTDEFTIGLAGVEHITKLKSISRDLYKDSRYFFDGNFDLGKINTFYAEWLEKAVLGTFDNECYCVFRNKAPVAFCTVRYKNDSVYIGLFGVDNLYKGRGLGKILLNEVISTMKRRGLSQMFVVTQGRNYFAQRLYQSAGFRTFSTELWYHKWIK